MLEHTSSGSVTDFSINGMSLPEGGYNALIAGSYGVPVVFAAGDKAICDQLRTFLSDLETVAVKEGIGAAANSLHPDRAHELIRAGVARALSNLDRYEPFTMEQPYTLVLTLKDEEMVYRGSHFPGAERTGDWELTFRSDDILEIMYAFGAMRR
jgi:D-amino peptidase